MNNDDTKRCTTDRPLAPGFYFESMLLMFTILGFGALIVVPLIQPSDVIAINHLFIDILPSTFEPHRLTNEIANAVDPTDLSIANAMLGILTLAYILIIFNICVPLITKLVPKTVVYVGITYFAFLLFGHFTATFNLYQPF
ncbi:hypothetical protein [Vibrio barjaei]|uniref:hypothetical protein n=1 Tax=Vibrio barjaei TaxID=1676683 RepID=UPI0022838C29|nr:hypothetical protein [Vibrio barjaei]MCY9872965.1 hypothetical protein [Vibrio barjaei]